jgi:hypothetical protein
MLPLMTRSLVGISTDSFVVSCQRGDGGWDCRDRPAKTRELQMHRKRDLIEKHSRRNDKRPGVKNRPRRV